VVISFFLSVNQPDGLANLSIHRLFAGMGGIEIRETLAAEFLAAPFGE
jgi:hypothetical protein